MELYLLRHAIAHDLGADGSKRDFERSLTREGKSKMYQAARGIQRMELDFDVVLTSPLVRARETAEIVVEVLAIPERLSVTENLAAGFDPDRLLRELAGSHQHQSMLLVGHEPDLSQLAARLVFGQELDHAFAFKKGGLCSIWVPQLTPLVSGTLRWYLTPRHMRLMAGEE